MDKITERILNVRQGLSEMCNALRPCTGYTAREIVELRYSESSSILQQKMLDVLEEVGVFRVDSLTEIEIFWRNYSNYNLLDMGLLNKNKEFLLSGRYCIPIRGLLGEVVAIVGWDPDGNNATKYLTTPSLGFSKKGCFFNSDSYTLSLDQAYPRKVENTAEVLCYLVEGIFDTLTLKALGFPVLGNMGVEVSGIKTEMLQGRYTRVVAITDGDTTGKSCNPYIYTDKCKKKNLWVFDISHIFAKLPRGVKDIDDYIHKYAGKSLEEKMASILALQNAKTLTRNL